MAESRVKEAPDESWDLMKQRGDAVEVQGHVQYRVQVCYFATFSGQETAGSGVAEQRED